MVKNIVAEVIINLCVCVILEFLFSREKDKLAVDLLCVCMQKI